MLCGTVPVKHYLKCPCFLIALHHTFPWLFWSGTRLVLAAQPYRCEKKPSSPSEEHVHLWSTPRECDIHTFAQWVTSKQMNGSTTKATGAYFLLFIRCLRKRESNGVGGVDGEALQDISGKDLPSGKSISKCSEKYLSPCIWNKMKTAATEEQSCT